MTLPAPDPHFIYLFIWSLGWNILIRNICSGQPLLGPLLNPHIKQVQSSKNDIKVWGKIQRNEIKKVWVRPSSFLKCEHLEEVVAYHQTGCMFSVATKDCRHCIVFDGQCVTFGGLQYFTWCGSREDKPFLQSTSEFLICIRNCWRQKVWYLKLWLGSWYYGRERRLVSSH